MLVGGGGGLGWLLAGWLASAVAAPNDADLLRAYEAIRVPLVRDDVDSARVAAASLQHEEALPADIAAATTRLATAQGTDPIRAAFGELSRALILRFSADGAPDGARVFRCPMTPTFPYWVQAGSGIANPYMGAAMPTCGEGASWKAAARAAEDR